MRTARVIETLVRAGIPVMGHIGLTPQAINTVGKIRVQGKTRDQARSLIADAHAVQEAGAFAMVVELVPEQLAAAITERVRIPTIGIGAGAGCSGQVQVITDLIGFGVNGVTGDYSRGASGFWIENGKKAWPVSGLTIAGNLKYMFLNLTPASDLQFKSSTNAPTVRIEGMTIAGS